MTVVVQLHNPVCATSRTVRGEKGLFGVVSIQSDDGGEIPIFTTPEMARAIADAVNGSARREAAE